MKKLDNINYYKIVGFLEALKIIHGPLFVSSTLKKHPKLAEALLIYEKDYILELESNLIEE